MMAEVASGIARRTGIRRVALTGGVFQNALLARQAAARLRAESRRAGTSQRPVQRRRPVLGQALLAIRKVRSGTLEEHRMCPGIPGRVVEFVDEARQLAKVDVASVRRTVHVGLLLPKGRAR